MRYIYYYITSKLISKLDINLDINRDKLYYRWISIILIIYIINGSIISN